MPVDTKAADYRELSQALLKAHHIPKVLNHFRLKLFISHQHIS